MKLPRLRTIAEVFFRIGTTTFGSGSTTVVLLSREMTARGWLERWQVDLCYALARIVPGTNVLAFVSSSAYALRGWAGATTAILATSVPAAMIVVLLTLAYGRWHRHPAGGAVITSAMAAIVGIIIAAGVLLALPKWKPGERIRTVTLVLGAALLSMWLSPLSIVAFAAAAGFFWPERR